MVFFPGGRELQQQVLVPRTKSGGKVNKGKRIVWAEQQQSLGRRICRCGWLGSWRQLDWLEAGGSSPNQVYRQGIHQYHHVTHASTSH